MTRTFYTVLTTTGKAHKYNRVMTVEDTQFEAYKAYVEKHLRENKLVRPTTEIHFEVVSTDKYECENHGFKIEFNVWENGMHKTIALEW